MLDPEHDLISAVVAWVEQAHAPGAVLATKFKDDDMAKGIGMQRPPCPYPATATYNGAGDTNDAVNFSCRKP